jgi:hypothetical protein
MGGPRRRRQAGRRPTGPTRMARMRRSSGSSSGLVAVVVVLLLLPYVQPPMRSWGYNAARQARCSETASPSAIGSNRQV